jgi:hypothetical protein
LFEHHIIFYRNAHEIAETLNSKLFYLLPVFLAIIVNVIILFGGIYSSKGYLLSMSPFSAETILGVVLQSVLLLSNILTTVAMDCGARIFFALRLCSPKGYSLAACGFMQTPIIKRLSFTNQLSLNSTCRSLMFRFSIIWLFNQSLIFAAFIISAGLTYSTTSMITKPVTCITMDPTNMFDRLYPTFKTELGFAEFVFGNALGCMRSQRSDCLIDSGYSTFVFPPQLTGSIGSGNTIIGPGFWALVSSTCNCRDINSTAFASSGYMTATDISYVKGNITSTAATFLYLSNNAYVVNDDKIKMYMSIGNNKFCGGGYFVFHISSINNF